MDIFTSIEWNKNAFNRLVLPAGIKLIDSLIRADRRDGSVIQDIIAGKDGGCIIVLHERNTVVEVSPTNNLFDGESG